MIRKILDHTLVPALTIAIIVLVIWGFLALTKKAGENLAPIKPRVLVFGASWCKYCPSERALQQLQDDFPQVEIEAYDADEDAEQFAKYHVQRTPTFIVCDESHGCKVFFSLAAVRGWLTNGEVQ